VRGGGPATFVFFRERNIYPIRRQFVDQLRFEMVGRDLDCGLWANGPTLEETCSFHDMVPQGPTVVGSLDPLARLNGLWSHDVELIKLQRMLSGDLDGEGVA
jgi:hypothetical protein